jgi:hypothetical protein
MLKRRSDFYLYMLPRPPLDNPVGWIRLAALVAKHLPLSHPSTTQKAGNHQAQPYRLAIALSPTDTRGPGGHPAPGYRYIDIDDLGLGN